jgi:glycosyltransferase 2 family protein
LLKKINWRVLFGVAISAIVLYLILKDVSLPDLGAELVQGDYRWLVLGTVVLVIAMWLRAVRWRVLLDDRISDLRSFHIQNSGNFLNNVLPLRLGELGKAYLAGRNSSITTMQALSTVFLERILDVLTMFVFLLAVLPFVPNQGVIVSAGETAAAIAVIGVIVLFIAAAMRERAVTIARVVLRFLPETPREGLLKWGDDFLRGISAAGGRRLLIATFWSFLIWACWGVASLSVCRIFIRDASIFQSIFLTCAQALGLSIPSAPSGAGIYEGATIAGLAVFGISREVALAVGLTGHIYTFILTAIFGVIGLDREGESFGHIITATQALMGRPTVAEPIQPE